MNSGASNVNRRQYSNFPFCAPFRDPVARIGPNAACVDREEPERYGSPEDYIVADAYLRSPDFWSSGYVKTN